jgi:hypothetical protein
MNLLEENPTDHPAQNGPTDGVLRYVPLFDARALLQTARSVRIGARQEAIILGKHRLIRPTPPRVGP